MTYDLLERYLWEEHEVIDLNRLRQSHLDGFDRFLSGLYSTYGKSPGDKRLSIAKLRVITEKPRRLEH